MNLLSRRLCLLLSLLCLAAVPLEAATSSNTIVRFQLRKGVVPFGNIDVELFDHDKPVTVSNFLHYVRSSAYDHSFLDNVIPGYILQGGSYRVENPYAETFFENAQSITEAPAIVNEFNAGRIIPNTFGTLAMALTYSGSVPNPDSATTAWFFNTTNNATGTAADFDSQGFTVFGRVKAGASVLKSFNALSEDKGILNMNGDNFYYAGCAYPVVGTNELAFTSLPVAYKTFHCLTYSDLYNVTVSVLSSPTNSLDATAPKLVIQVPAKNAIITTNELLASGTISDNLAVDSVLVYLNTNAPVPATVTAGTWSALLTGIPAGTNSLAVEATDDAGNRMTVATKFFFEVRLPFTLLEPNGSGRGQTFGPTNQQMLVIDKVYSIAAKPDRGNLFIGWQNSNNIVSQNTTLSFLMRSNTTVNAKFDTNFFPFLKGVYNGLFVNPESADPAGSGFFTMTLTDVGAYSAKLVLNGRTFPFSGGFNSTLSNGYPFFSPTGLPGLTILRMGFDILTLEPHLVGNLTNFWARLAPGSSSDIVTNTWFAELKADRVPAYSGTNRSRHAGKYTLLFPADTSSPLGPSGDGYGIVSVSPSGALTFAGALADGLKISQKTYVSDEGYWPLYLAPLKTNAALISWITFTNDVATDFNGRFNWFSYSNSTTYYPQGFTNEAMLLGSRFLAPNATNRMLALSNATVGFTNSNLVADFTNHIALDAKGKVTNQSTNKLSLSISSSSGLFSGSVTPPLGGKVIPFKGAVLQKQNRGAGFFPGTNQNGGVSLLPRE